MKLKRIHITEPLKNKVIVKESSVKQTPVKYLAYEPHDLSKMRKLKRIEPFSEGYNQIVTRLIEAMNGLSI